MFGPSFKAAKEYEDIDLETKVVAASPIQLVVLLYDGAISACKSAVIHIANKHMEKKGQSISKAIMIIESGLRVSLNKEAGGEVAENLDAMYRYMSDCLYVANLRVQAEPVQEVIDLLVDLRSAWVAISRSPAAVENQAIGNKTSVILEKVAS